MASLWSVCLAARPDHRDTGSPLHSGVSLVLSTTIVLPEIVSPTRLSPWHLKPLPEPLQWGRQGPLGKVRLMLCWPRSWVSVSHPVSLS